MLGFETLTFAPIDRGLIDVSLMDPSEIAWLDEYHARVFEKLAPLVDTETQVWLSAATRPID
jgi:Xaa-Pro aminopeptidase